MDFDALWADVELARAEIESGKFSWANLLGEQWKCLWAAAGEDIRQRINYRIPKRRTNPLTVVVTSPEEALKVACGPTSDEYQLALNKLITRTKQAPGKQRKEFPPIEVLMRCIQLGMYPPPELLLALLASWQRYQFGAGRVSLEEAFIGKSRQKSGNYASRQKLGARNQAIYFLIQKRRSEGHSLESAAEMVVSEMGLDLEVETALKLYKDHRRSVTRKRKSPPRPK